MTLEETLAANYIARLLRHGFSIELVKLDVVKFLSSQGFSEKYSKKVAKKALALMIP